MRPGPSLSGPKTTLLLYGLIIATITIVVGSTVWMGQASDQPLPVKAELDQRMVDVPDGSGARLTDVIVLTNLSGDALPKIDISINAQYFLYRDSPLAPHEELVLPQSIFSTKSSLRFNPDNYPIQTITVTGRLPSGARGVYEMVIEDAASHATEE
ncbi:hypothetical protein CA51_18970 [Rosistilla oblonga]|uniref:Uncharacterized protein n=2 Tax=Rosistilla TaxID=2795779 RepID=A0A518ISC1_9BACT|nr:MULTISPECIES: hypothetical protein [Rosistilla]QDS87693.1 hypothetical protein EC9_18720 [Rosistilla ulvae]QDV12021.1 hypothetical protein CA51_18970 [Rosistilla oblonga]QDV55971.1 hypothetical protein Mal33_19500 [Rosistilla oblonga]